MQRQRRPPTRTLAMIVAQMELIKGRELTGDEVTDICYLLLTEGLIEIEPDWTPEKVKPRSGSDRTSQDL